MRNKITKQAILVVAAMALSATMANATYQDCTVLPTSNPQEQEFLQTCILPFMDQDGLDGIDGTTPHIGGNGNWYLDKVDTGVAATGPAGANGTNGQDGTDGKDGLNGQDGQDGTNGLNGTDGQDGQDGTAGATGNTGATGSAGANGKDGTDGIDGTDGTDGVKGDTGAAGSNGVDGVDGSDGSDGTDGKDGETLSFDKYREELSEYKAELAEYQEKLDDTFQYTADAAAGNMATAAIDFGTVGMGQTEGGIGLGISGGDYGGSTVRGYAIGIGVKHGISDTEALIAKGWYAGNDSYAIGGGMTKRF